jgi:DNA-binding transcriptional MerR regulator
MSTAQSSEAQTLSISQVSARTGLSADTLRYYEKAGLLQPIQRSSSGQRRYATADMDWLAFLLRLRETGMPIADMQRYAQLRAQGEASLAERLAMLREHRAQLSERIRALQASAHALDGKIHDYERQIEERS